MILSSTGLESFESTIWFNNSYQTYVKGFQPLDIDNVDIKIAGLTKKYAGPQLEQMMGRTFDEFIAQGNAYAYYLRPVKSIHLYSDTGEEIEPGGDIKYIYLFSGCQGIVCKRKRFVEIGSELSFAIGMMEYCVSRRCTALSLKRCGAWHTPVKLDSP